MYSPFAIKNRVYLPLSVRREGYKAFQHPTGEFEGHYGEFIDQSIFAISQDHVLGTSDQYASGLCSIYYDGTNFIGFTDLTKKLSRNPTQEEIITLNDYDRITIVIDMMERSITFPDKFLIIKNYSVMDMDGFDLTIPGRVDGELNFTGTSSTLNLSGQVEAMILNYSVASVNFTGSGSYFDNGTLTT